MTDDRTSQAMTDDRTAETGTAYACIDCDNRWYYARARCPECRSDSYDTYELGTGTLLAETTARVTPPNVRDENSLGLAEFDDGVTVVAQVTDEESSPEVGDDVKLAGEFPLRGDVTGPRLCAAERAPNESNLNRDEAKERRA